MNQYPFSFNTVHLGSRPARIAVFINKADPHWQDTVQRIFEWLSKCWGGEYGLIIPTDGNSVDERFWYLLEKYSPDYIVRYNKTYADIKIADPDLYDKILKNNIDTYLKRNPDIAREWAEEEIPRALLTSPVNAVSLSSQLQKELIARLAPFYYQDHVVNVSASATHDPGHPLTHQITALDGRGDAASLHVISPTINASKDFQNIFYSAMGKFDTALFDQLSSRPDIAIDHRIYEGEGLRQLSQLAWHERERPDEGVPFSLTRVGLSYFYKSRDRFEYKEKPVVILGDTFEDLCLYYNLSRLRWNIYWLPMRLVKLFIEAYAAARESGQVVDGEAAYFSWLVNELKSITRDKETQRVYIYSASCAEGDLSTIEEAYGKVSSVIFIGEEPEKISFEYKRDIRDLLPYVRRLYTLSGLGRGYVEQFLNGESVNYLNTPIPKEFPKIHPYKHLWFTDVIVDDHLLPPHPALGTKSIILHNYGSDKVRASRDGLVYFCPHIGYFSGWGQIENYVAKPKLRLLEDFAIVEELFRWEGYHIRCSDKGNYHRESALKFGNLNNLGEYFLDDKKRKLLGRFLDNNPSRPNEDAFLKPEKRRYLLFASINSILGDIQVNSLLDDLLQKDILNRGLIFQCEKCRNSAWYSIEDVGNTFTCSRCRTTQAYKKDHWKEPADGPLWYYGLSEVVYQGLSHNMHVPVLTLRLLKKESKEAFHYVPEIELRSDATSEKPDCEIDFVAIKDGDVILGEATVSDKIANTSTEEERQIQRLKEIAVKLRVSTVVFATTATNWSSGTIKRIEQKFSDTSIELRLLTKSDLSNP